MMRYRPVAVLGAPHALTVDEVVSVHIHLQDYLISRQYAFNGQSYLLKAGTIVMQNQWAQLHDPDMCSCSTACMTRELID